ncbi:MAG: hypothetical protein PHY44_08155 [Lachnospiraceae bacterium]|nr:hypothetical protein [Lachnospiraceae bacterium]
MKNVFKLIAISALVLVFAGCSSGVIAKEKINTDIVTIYYDELSNAKPLVFSKSNPDDVAVIDQITAIASKTSEYKIVPKDKLNEGTCQMWVKFGNDMVIGIYSDMDYGYIGKEIDPVGEDVMYLPEGLSKCIQDIIDVYGYTYKSFSGEVTAVHDNSITITPAADSNEIKSADSIVVSVTEYTKVFDDKTLEDISTKNISVGNTVDITYDGTIQESYPAGIPGATMIRVYK